MNTAATGTIFVIHPVGQIFNIPCVPNIADVAGRDGTCKVHFIGIRNLKAPEGTFGPGISTVSWYPETTQARNEPLRVWLFGYTAFARMVIGSSRPGVLLAVGLRGLIVGWLLHLITGMPLSYYSLEFYPGPSLKRRVLRSFERFCLKAVRLLIMHDLKRLSVYEQFMGTRVANTAFFPNEPLYAEPSDASHRAVEAKLGIDRSRKYILYSGGLYSEFPARACVDIVEQLGSGWALILQSHDGHMGLDTDERFQAAVVRGDIILNTKPLAVDEYCALVKMVRIGLAVYSTADDNMKYVGLSSGKVGMYWRAGIPVILNKLPFYDTVCPAERSGATFTDLDEIPTLVRQIDSQYSCYTDGASASYRRYFDCTSYAGQLTTQLRRLLSE